MIIKEFENFFVKFYQLLKKSKTILLLRHIYPDGDCVGAQLALFHFIKLNFPNKIVHFIGQNIEYYLEDLFPEDKILKQKKLLNQYDLQILVDTSTISRVDGPLNLSKKTILIDHHTLEDLKCFFSIRDVTMSSTCEIISNILLFFKEKYKLVLNKQIAQSLYIGITTDTKRMWYGVKPRLLLVLVELLKYNINTNYINETIYYWRVNEIRFRNILIDKAKINGLCISVILDIKDYLEYELDYQTTKDLALSIVEIKEGKYFLIAVKNIDSGLYHVSLRSRQKRIDKLAIRFGGGGHKLASGVKLPTKKKVLVLLKELILLSQNNGF